ncbi:Ni-sirohydrochlorin a,c-diamide synthase [Methanobacterium alcaliphilum]|uniref:Ni-sirohydrochlorin a,c-diamide synthase n=1 Tax=Methanobacterium alcaliphilum TaxID=392018 RepID=UPI00200A8260|nr:Ni-sirohydrochlorin a,c-diamide synthase [Methanobacterium alcaliphilum]MCK9151172.1 Ni-sirohydrochlorin a,c-diamide synthase [Methanobacterium alcaliphilum]
MRIVLAGTGSAVGKTTISTGIMSALSSKNKIQPFKVGPDYIDPTYHTLATGKPSRNLDSFFMSEAQIREAFFRAMKISNSKIGIIEGVRGLYEGISPTGDVGNTASIAKALNAPVILIMNARSLVKSAAAVVLGFKMLDPEIKIEGVILNQVKGQRHYLKAKEAIETLTNTPVIGGIPRSDSLTVEQRHLGLVPAVERENLLGFIEKWSRVVEENIDLELLEDIMGNAGKISSEREDLWQITNRKKVKVGVALDEIFTFYYKENLEALEDNSAKVIPFSPYHDEEVPDVDALYIGGGYPEIFAGELEKNQKMLQSVKKFHLDGRPLYAECGGLMYLMQSINQHKMSGVFPYPATMTKKVQGLSYVIAKAQENNIISKKGDIFRGHEFHYSKIKTDNHAKFAFEIIRGKGIINSQDGIMEKNTVASYVHTHAAACPGFAANLTKNAAEF